MPCHFLSFRTIWLRCRSFPYWNYIHANIVDSHGIPLDKAEQGAHYIPDRNSTSVISMVVDSDGKVSNHTDHRLVPSYSSGIEILYWKSHLV